MKQLNHIEYLRAFSMLYIVGYWHLFNYTEAFPGYHNVFTYRLTFVVLGLFVFISGFLIARTTMKSKNAIYFYKKKLIRIYPLYVLAVLLFYIYGINAAETSIKSLVFISMYDGPPPLTLWFIAMLLLFYLVTPFLLQLIDHPVKYLFLIALVFVLTLILRVIFKAVDLRVLLYFPSFCLGIYCARQGLKIRLINMKSALLLFVPGLILSFIEIDSWTLNKLKDIPMVLSASYLIFVMSDLSEHRFKKVKLVSLLSYSSFAMYLFHRPVYITMKTVYFPENGPAQILYLITAALMMVAIISWCIQKAYDKGYNVLNRSLKVSGTV